jgi:hypothetical protein
MPRFSVLMANYNNGRYIDEAISSVLGQTFTDWELVVIDDASEDDSLERIKKYLGDPRIRLFVKHRNEGYTKTLIYGLTKVDSSIVGFLDSDDALVPEAIAKGYAVHDERSDVGLVLSQMIICDSGLQPLFITTNTPDHLREPLLWMRGCTHFRTFKLADYKKTAGLDASLRGAEDWDLLFKLEEATSVHRIDEPLYMYRQRSSSVSNTPRAYHRGARALALYRAYLRRRRIDQPNLPQAALLAWIVGAVQYSLELAQPAQALVFALRALRIAPVDGASWRALTKSVKAWIGFSPAHEIQLAPGTGHTRLRYYPVSAFQSNTGNIEADRVVCIPLIHRRGHCLFGGDHVIVQDGRYEASFDLAVEAYSFAEDPLVILDVYENLQNKTVLAERQIKLADIERRRSFDLQFSAREGQRVEFRVFWDEQCFLSVNGVLLEMSCAVS